MVGKYKYIDVYFLSRNLVSRNTEVKITLKTVFPPNDESQCTEGNYSCKYQSVRPSVCPSA